ncbi:MAG TPA: PD-(D/E)XK nuclease family protein [Polyangiaceae bacterium]|nr:PD-(D/E)XK nuclease family protein [Polyangiaceae bacterium]
MRLSASQIETFVSCQRKWAWKYVTMIEVPDGPGAALGRQTHAALQTYLEGGKINFTTEVGYIAASGLHHLPKPGTEGLLVEQEFHFEGPSGHTYLGYKDLEVPGVIYDHKTTSDLKWQKTAEQLAQDIQATLYATDYFRKNPDKPDVELRWVYYQTRGAKKSAVTHLRVAQQETWDRFVAIEKIASEMEVASQKQPLELPPSIDHCSAYGGCPHQGRCNLSPFDKMRSHVNQNKLLAKLKPQNKTNGAAAAPSAAPAPAQTPLAFAPGGAHHGTAAAAAPAGNKLLARMKAAGAPAASAPAPAAVNPPETDYGNPAAAAPQPAPAPAALPAPAAAAPEAAAEGRGRPRKAALPETGVTTKIKVLYVNCAPVGAAIEDAAQLIALGKKVLESEGLADYRFAEYGQGPGMLAVAAIHQLDTIDGVIAAMRLDTTTPEGQIIASDLMARAALVVR